MTGVQTCALPIFIVSQSRYLEARLKQSCKAFEDSIGDISEKKVLELLNKRIEELDIKMAKDDVSRFIYDQRELELWSKEFFKAIASMIKFNVFTIKYEK